MRAGAVVLAAGASSRMGRPKMTLPYGDSTILGTVVGALLNAEIEAVAVVLGFEAEAVAAALPPLSPPSQGGDRGGNVRLIVNPNPERGMLSSAQCGLRSLPPDLDAYLFALGDQPSLTPASVNELLRCAADSPQGIVVPAHEGKRGHPVLFKARYRQALLDLPLTVGLNALLREHPDDILLVPADDRALEDVDTPEDYRRATED